MIFTRKAFFLVFALVFLPRVCLAASEKFLTPEENKWLLSKNNVVIVRPENNYPPFIFSTGVGMQGLGVDYLELIAKEAGFKIQYFDPSPLSSILSSLKEGKNGVVVAISKTADREDYLNFTKPFITVPAVIVIRKDSNIKDKNVTLADFSGKIVAVGKSYAVESYIKENYSKVVIDEVVDDEVGIQKLLLGEVDAAVMDLASLSYYTSKKALPYVSIGGQTGFDYQLAFGISKDMPLLVSIFDKALETITPQQRLTMRDTWITFKDQAEPHRGVKEVISENSVLIVALIFLSIFFTVIIYFLIRNFSKTQNILIRSIWNRTPTKDQNQINEKIKELEEAKHAIAEELEHIETIEEEIKKEIK